MAHHHGRLNEQVLQRLRDMLNDINPYFHAFHTASECLRETMAIVMHLTTIDVFHLDSRRYNRPTAAEVAIIMPSTGEEQVDRHDIVLHSQAGPLKRISELHSAYLPLYYSIIHPFGEQSWSLSLKEST